MRRINLFLLILLVLGGCAEKEIPDIEQAVETPPPGYEKEYDRGPVTFLLETDKREITIAEKLMLTLETESDKDWEVRFPVIGGKLDSFSITNIINSPDELTDDGRIRRKLVYELDPFLSGEYRIPSLSFQYRQGEEDYRLMESEEIPITVKSIIDENSEGLMIKGLSSPVVPPVKVPLVWIILVIIFALLVFLGIFLYLKIKKARALKNKVPLIPAHELAYRALEYLVAEKYVEQGEISLFYTGITGILRQYIEDRFNLRAPEQTTEEFLESIKNDSHLTGSQKGLLSHFLNHCDLVKFAEYQPTNEDIQETFNRCRHFIQETSDPEVKVMETIAPYEEKNTQEEGGLEL